MLERIPSKRQTQPSATAATSENLCAMRNGMLHDRRVHFRTHDNDDNDRDNDEEKKSLEFHSDHLPKDNVECLGIIDLMRNFGVDPDENDDAEIGKEVLAVALVKFIPLYKAYVKDSLRLETLLEGQSVPLSEA
ncbi:MAG: hypothetical protein M1835_007680 [Candelina submexicana]|nr:MAG: hypothetical protein M1835_007680 [Candelina submexicana]